jgi:hypothetical protein
MSNREITAKAGQEEDAPSATVVYDFGDDLEEAVELFGADVVYKRFLAAATVDIQALIRRGLTRVDKDKQPNPMSTEELQTQVSEWKPGVTKARKSKTEKAQEAFESLSEEERNALLASLGLSA